LIFGRRNNYAQLEGPQSEFQSFRGKHEEEDGEDALRRLERTVFPRLLPYNFRKIQCTCLLAQDHALLTSQTQSPKSSTGRTSRSVRREIEMKKNDHLFVGRRVPPPSLFGRSIQDRGKSNFFLGHRYCTCCTRTKTIYMLYIVASAD